MSGAVLFGQSRKDLESKRLEIIKNIEKTNKNLENTKKKKQENAEKLKLLEQQIAQREKLIQNLSYEAVSYTHLRAHETVLDIVCRLLLEKQTKSTTARS